MGQRFTQKFKQQTTAKKQNLYRQKTIREIYTKKSEKKTIKKIFKEFFFNKAI